MIGVRFVRLGVMFWCCGFLPFSFLIVLHNFWRDCYVIFDYSPLIYSMGVCRGGHIVVMYVLREG